MSDFLYTRQSDCSQQLAETLQRLTWVGESDVLCFDGAWGSLAVTKNHHRGFQPYETDEAIAVVVGGPLPKVLFVDEPGINDENRGTATVCKRFFEERSADWHFDLLAPCCFLHIDKRTHSVAVVTDEMSFIPAYFGFEHTEGHDNYLALSTHSDAVALAIADGDELQVDPVSACDLVIHRVITYPHTFHKNVRELAPASIHHIEPTSIESKSYWQPVEGIGKYRRIRDAAHEAREALVEVVERAADYYGKLGLLLSAGEDSRLLACMAPPGTQLHCLTVAPSENREMRLAGQVAKALGASWESVLFPVSNYFQAIGRRCLFTGSNTVGGYAHFTGLLEDSALARQPIVMGGFKSDTFLKGHYVRSRPILKGIPYQVLNPTPRPAQKWGDYFSDELLGEVNARKCRHREWIASYLPESADRWTPYWPMSQDHEIGHFWSNRRMFPSLEVFMTARILDLASSVPEKWTLNRRLFQKTAAPYLRKLWWIPHGDGHYPAFPWYVNLPIKPLFRTWWKLRLGSASRRQGAWPTLEEGLESAQSAELAKELSQYGEQLDGDFANARYLLDDVSLLPTQRYAYLQVLAMVEQFAQPRVLF